MIWFLCLMAYQLIGLFNAKATLVEEQRWNYLAHMAQTAGAAEYTDCISAHGYDSSNECPGYYTKQSDGEAPVMLELWEMQSTPYCHRSQVLSGPEL